VRRKDVEWTVHQQGTPPSVEQAQLAVLMDIRDELKDVKRALTAIRVDVGPILHDTRAAAKRIDKRLTRGRKLR
jgi:hypothetical protein